MSKLGTWRLFIFVPALGRTGNSTRKFGLSTMVCIVLVFCAATAIAAPAPTFTTLVNFDGTNGAFPLTSLVQGADGNFYGTANQGGPSRLSCAQDGLGCGTVFKITPTGTLTTLYNFCVQGPCIHGGLPMGALVLATDGNFYGTTFYGGTNCGYYGCGTVFKISPAGKLTTLYSFCSQTGCTDGEALQAGLVQATNGNFYGTTEQGGAGDFGPGGAPGGTIFEITPVGRLTTLYSFCSQPQCLDGSSPYTGLVQATDGNFYGTTVFGGASKVCPSPGCGTIFKITAGGQLTTLYSFCSQANCADGSTPLGALVQASDGNLYGTTAVGGANGGGTVFKITTSGLLTTLHNFDIADGSYADAPLVQATDGNFYGTTRTGGADIPHNSPGYGTVFKMTAAGTLTTLHSFHHLPDGSLPEGGLIQATNGNFYGVTFEGRDSTTCDDLCYGTVFSLAVGLGPFVETEPTSGMVGADVVILGNNLTGASSVTFNGKAATFNVVSSTEITTTIPSGATTGKVEVTTPSGTLTSNVNFRVGV
jgi:uncharacterized repeat protein (TIGR03803 family)